MTVKLLCPVRDNPACCDKLMVIDRFGRGTLWAVWFNGKKEMMGYTNRPYEVIQKWVDSGYKAVTM